MTAYIAQAFNTQFFDGATVAAGYSLYTYDSGTVTPKTVYKNQAGTVAHTNPIVLDADGMPPGGTIWITSGEVTFVLKDLLGATVWTRDDIAGSSSTVDDAQIRADLADDSSATEGSALIGHNATLNYAIGTIGWIENRVANVGMFPWLVIGDGTDESAGINAAVAWLDSAGGGTLEFNKGVYGVGTNILLRSKIHYKGQGVGITVFKALGSGNIFGEPHTVSAVQFITMSGFEIDGNSAAISFATDDAEGNAIRLNQVQFSKFHDLYIHDTQMNAVSVYNLSHDNEFVDIRCATIGKTGTPPSAWTMCGFFFEAGSSRNKVVRPRITNAKQYGIWIGARDADNYDNEIESPYISGSVGDGIRIGDEATANRCWRPRIINPTILSCGDIGIRAYHAGTGEVVDLEVLGGMIQACTNRGILLDTNCLRGRVIGAKLKDNGTHNITVAGTDCEVDVYATGATTADIENSGTRSIIHWKPGRGADIASASTIVIPSIGSIFTVTGTTDINSLNPSNQDGRQITLMFSGVLTVNDVSNLRMNGNFVTSADDTLTLYCDGTYWRELSRSAN